MYSKNVLFQSKNGTLGTRIDLAWNKLIAQASNEQEQRDALEFLVFVFDIDIYANPNTSIIDQLSFMMMEREIYKKDNPEYIPNQAPKILAKIEITPALRVTQKAETDQSASPRIATAIKNQELIEVVPSAKKKDKYFNATYLTPEQREHHRLLIRNGEFYHEGEKFDSSKFSSHGKKGFVGYTLNANGEISFFNHLDVRRDKQGRLLFHSSMNAGAPVIAAGELKIENGKLKEITTHSGHYRPSLFNVYRVLNHFDDKNLDLTDVKVITTNKVPNSVSINCKKSTYKHYSGNPCYEVPAADVLNGIKQLFNENIIALNKYTKGDFKSNFLRMIGYELTVERERLAKKFSSDIEEIFKADINPEEKIEHIRQLTEDYISTNQSYAQQYRKEQNNGELAQVFCKFKHTVDEIKNQKKTGEDLQEEQSSSYKMLH